MSFARHPYLYRKEQPKPQIYFKFIQQPLQNARLRKICQMDICYFKSGVMKPKFLLFFL